MFAASKTASVSGGYQISRSLRFNSADSAYLNRTPASDGNQLAWTISLWVKRSKNGAEEHFIDSTGFQFYFDASDVIGFIEGGTNLQTSQVFRDNSAWYHIVAVWDSANATSSDRARLYINGSRVTAFGSATYPVQNRASNMNRALATYIGKYYGASSGYMDGYMTEVNFIDGQALTPSSFGETNAQTGVWQPKAYSGSYGTNGFYLNFSDNSNTTAATLGKDYSGNGNNWTPNNFSVSAGAGNDSLVDTPTAYGTDTGVGGEVRGNYCTLNPVSARGATLTNGNLDASVGGDANAGYGTIGISSGKWYWEVLYVSGTNSMIGIANTITGTGAWVNAYGWAYYEDGAKYTNNTRSAGYGASYAANAIIGVALDMDAGTLTFYKNGVSQGVAYSSLSGTMTPYVGNGGGTTTYTCNFGQRPFAYTAPSGYKALCTQNLPTPTIGATTATQAGKYFNPVLYTGTGATQTISTVGFSPGLMVLKNRTDGTSYVTWQDQLRGASVRLFSSLTNAESTDTNGVSAFTSTGFSLGTNGNENLSGGSFVAWSWLANTSGSSNTAGSITSTVSANTTSGFSVVTYTGNGTNPSTVGHGLGVAPSFVIVKTRNSASYDWNCYHISLGNTQYIALNTTAAASSAVSLWNNTSPTSTVFTINHAAVNTSSNTYVAYCFAEVAGYSKFGSYTANASTDGPFIYCGFRPMFVMFKRSSVASNWAIHDNARDPYNTETKFLFPNSSSAEVDSSSYAVDFVSNGFKIRSTGAETNQNSGETYIFAAFAESPFKYSLAR